MNKFIFNLKIFIISQKNCKLFLFQTNKKLQPVSPVLPVIDYEIDNYKKDPIYSHPTKFKSSPKQQSILKPTSYFTKEPFKLSKAHSCNSIQERFQQNNSQNKYCTCNQCNNFDYNSYRNIQTLNNENKEYSHIYKVKNNKKNLSFDNNEHNFYQNNQTSSYLPRYQRRYERSRTISPRHEMYQNRKHEKDWHCNTEFRNRKNSTSITDSGRSSSALSFSPLSLNSSMSQFSAHKPYKKITRKSRFVSIYDGRPVSLN